MGLHPEILMAVGYTVFLLGVALGMDFVVHRSHVRSERYRTAGFAYHHTHDAWICPEDQVLVRSASDHERRLVRYRGRSQICNRCPAKAECTDSNDGREVVRAMDPWPHSEADRFHRGISLAVALVAAPILAAVALRNHAPLELAVLGAALLVVALTAWRLRAAFRATPANFPGPKTAAPSWIPAESLRKATERTRRRSNEYARSHAARGSGRSVTRRRSLHDVRGLARAQGDEVGRTRVVWRPSCCPPAVPVEQGPAGDQVLRLPLPPHGAPTRYALKQR